MAWMDTHEEVAARKWVKRQLRGGVPVAVLHEMVDQVATGVLADALDAERRERHRADVATVERDDLRSALDGLRQGVAALDDTQSGGTQGP